MKTQKLMIIITCLLSILFFNISHAGKFKEIVSKRTAYSKTFYGGNGQYKTMISLRPIHFKTPEGYFKEIDLSSRSDTLSYLNFKGIYKEYVNSNYTGIGDGLSFVGNVSINDTTEHRYRSAQYWDVQGISDNVNIDSAKFQLDIAYYLTESMSIDLKDLNHYYPGYLDSIYDDCGSGTTFKTINLPSKSGHYENTFPGSSSFCQNLKSSLSKDWFGIGFYSSSETQTGINAQLTTHYGYLEVFYYNPSVPFEVIVNNDFGSGFYKVIFLGDTVQHTVPDTLYMFHGDQPGLMAVNQDYGNYYRVFRYWLEQPGNNQYTTNPLYISVTQDASYELRTRRQFEINLDNEYLNGGSGGYILVNDTSQNVPYTKFVLEDDSVTLEAPSQPILVNSKTVQYNFQEWSDGSTSNPRLFFPLDHGSLTAKYKGHLVTNSDEATAYNNSRHIAPEPNTYVNHFLWHAVYEDNGQIYYTHYNTSTNEWSAEFLVSEPEQFYINKSAGIACLAVNMQKTLVGIVWERQLVGLNDYEIGCRIYNTQTNTWSAPFYYLGASSYQNL